jgi:hypothetical protein
MLPVLWRHPFCFAWPSAAIIRFMANIKLIPCPACKTSVSAQAIACPRCGQPLSNRLNGTSAATAVNDSGNGQLSTMPAALRGFNWGAFYFGAIWAIFNNTWIGLLALVPGLSIIMAIVLGVKGNEWAWQNKRWDSVEHFFSAQRNWALWGLIIYATSSALGLIYYLGILLHTAPPR